MSRSRSIAREVAVRLILVFLLAPVIAVPVLLLAIDDEKPDLTIDRRIEAQADALVAALSKGSSGGIVLNEAAMAAAAPLLSGVRFAIYDGFSSEPALSWPRDAHFHNWDYHRSYDTYRAAPFGPVRILFIRRSGSEAWVDWIGKEITSETLPLLMVLLAVTVPLAVLTVRRSLAPVRRLALEAAAIEPGSGGARLTEAGAPLELVPLVRAINGGLERIDAGFAAQRRFSAVAAHELRTPLAVLAASLEREPLNGNRAKVRQKLRGMARLIDQLLVVSELSAKRIKTDDPIDLRKVVRDAVAEEVPSAIDSGVRLELCAPEQAFPLRGNAPAIATALRNLINNAVRHSPEGGLVTISVGPENPGAAGPWLEVADQGPGIPPGQREIIFEPFWRGSRSAGAGLGLAIVQQMAELHGARVTLRDNHPRGSVFRIEFGPH